MRVVQRGNDDTYRVIVSSDSRPWFGDGVSSSKRAICATERQRFYSSLQRTSSTIRALATLNRWDYWVTLTFDSRLVGGASMRWELDTVKAVRGWLHMYNVHYGLSIKYLLVPDLHADGAFHLHGLLAGLPESCIEWWTLESAPTARIRSRIKSGVPCGSWRHYAARFGFCRLEPLKSAGAAGHYLSSHYLGGIDKLEALAARLGAERNFLYHSKGLCRWRTVKGDFDEGLSLDVEAWALQLSCLRSFSDFVRLHVGHFIPVEAFSVSGALSDLDIVLWRRFVPDDVSIFLDVATCPVRSDIVRAFCFFCAFLHADEDFLSVFSLVPVSTPSSGDQFFQMGLLDSPSGLFPDSEIGFEFVPF